MPYIGRGSDFGVRSVFHFLASNGDTSVSGADADGKSLSFADGNFIDVYLNGVRLKSGEDYNTATANTVAGLSALNANDEVNIVVYDTFTVADTVKASTGGTFSGDVTTSGTFNATGDTASGDDASMGFTATEGLILTGQGSTSDITVKNDADTAVLTVPTGTTNVDIVGDVTASTLNADGDTSAGDSAAIGHTSAEGLILTGQGSTSDVTIKNDADVKVMAIPTGTRQVHIGDASANDSAIVFDGNAQDFYIGVQDSSDSLKIGVGSDLAVNTSFVLDANGHITKPLQPAFFATKTSAQSNMAAGSEVPITFNSERFDNNGDFASNTFTAPVTGKYQLNANVGFNQLETGASYIIIYINTSNKKHFSYIDPGKFASDLDYYSINFAVLADMDANDTSTLGYLQVLGTEGVDLVGGAGDIATSFSGHLVA